MSWKPERARIFSSVNAPLSVLIPLDFHVEGVQTYPTSDRCLSAYPLTVAYQAIAETGSLLRVAENSRALDSPTITGSGEPTGVMPLLV